MTDFMKQLKPGWNEIARQKDFPASDNAKKRGLNQKFVRRWVQTGPISISEANKLRDAGVLVMAQKRDDTRRKIGKDGKPVPMVGPLRPDMILLVKKTQRAAREMEAAE